MKQIYDIEYFKEQGRKGGKKVSRERGASYMRKIGARGLRAQGKRIKSK